mmetsp:Transcript_5901/g.10536  ORF Transcript_5901/g.10536 Transcript_5901/m.10536 type:complete len:451 (-) Transcript_5901:225-1577(-)|eukprot:CAMPEP_0197627808 /NCGR_PEP_ID=MMETSP1338-20131121/6315_1 /TAXON_ID=43686 ORGANISM="Pelagodinium beii, Strain RCC1491" /NCGR_SAMPLE_ID=MMETSP1338 /ASSEMBLY_ACC=CAM_ASM_000754 /LENGTH=450 /DNA_ID=CAMNT_0043198631 /DNA_START=62 /DNA_END=1414 /DNA_ORIENTATION=+
MACEEDSRTLLTEEGQLEQSKPVEGNRPPIAARRIGLTLTVALATAGVVALMTRSTLLQQPAVPEAAEAPITNLVEDGQCLPKCPTRRLNKVDKMENFITGKTNTSYLDLTEEQKGCIRDCPSEGYLATTMFQYCKVDCLRNSEPSAAQKGKIPEQKSPMQICMESCPEDGNLWKTEHHICAKKCENDEAAAQAKFEKQWPIVKHDAKDIAMEHKEIKVIAQMVKKFEILERPKRPASLVFNEFKSVIENSLQKVLGTGDGEVDVVLRMIDGGRRLSTIQDFQTYPGDVFEAVAELTDSSPDVLSKFAASGVSDRIDAEIKLEIEHDTLLRDAAQLFPCVIKETTSVSIEGNYVSMGFNTVCRRDEGDKSPDDYGMAKTFSDKSLRQCSQMCEGMHKQCHGFEYRASEQRCEIWKDPICHHERTPAVRASGEDFRCFKKCSVEEQEKEGL